MGIEESEAIHDFLTYLRESVVVAHHANFDIGILQQSFKRNIHPQTVLYNTAIDTAHIARKLEHPNKPSSHIDFTQYSLDALCDRYDISMEDRHTAWGDAMITAKLLLKLLHQVEEKGYDKLRWLVR